MRNVLLIAMLLTLGCAQKHPSPLIVEEHPAHAWAREADVPGVEGSITSPSEVAVGTAADLERFSLGYFGAEDMTVSARGTTTVPTTAPDAATERRGDLSKGTRFINVYGSTIFGDEGKGEMYLLHLGFGTHVADYQSISLDLFGGYARSGIDDDGGVIGFDVVYRNHFLRHEDDDWTIFFEGGLGVQEASTNFSGERHFNLRTRIGFGASFALDERLRAFVGGTYQHISDAGIEGGGGGFDGPMLWAGVAFPF